MVKSRDIGTSYVHKMQLRWGDGVRYSESQVKTEPLCTGLTTEYEKIGPSSSNYLQPENTCSQDKRV